MGNLLGCHVLMLICIISSPPLHNIMKTFYNNMFIVKYIYVVRSTGHAQVLLSGDELLASINHLRSGRGEMVLAGEGRGLDREGT